MEIFDGIVNRDPVVPLGVASKRYVDDLVQSNIGNGLVGQVYIVDVTPSSGGIVSAKQFVPNTIPANAVLSETSSDTSSVKVHIYAEGGSMFFSPVITVNGVIATIAKIPVGGDVDASRVYSGYADITIAPTGDTIVTAVSDTGATSNITIHRLGLGPVASNVIIGILPGVQTAAKMDDVISVTGKVENSASYAEIIAGGAAKNLSILTVGTQDSAGIGFKTISGNFSVSNLTGNQSISVRARNSFGTFGALIVSSNTIPLDQTYPTISPITVTYPPTQGALKDSETATASATIIGANTYLYSTSVLLSVNNPTIYNASKTITRLSGAYINSGTNYTISATRTSNNATTVATALIKIAHVAPTAAITISGGSTTLTSSPTGTLYTITLTASQLLNFAPTLSASGGTWQGSWSGVGTTWTRQLLITDSDVRGPHIFSGLSMTNIANVVGNSISSGSAYVIGGFSLRSIVFSPFSQKEPIGLPITDITKVVVQYAGIPGNLIQRNSTSDFVNGFTITNSLGDFLATGDYIFLTDSLFAGGNTTGTLTITIMETV